MLAAIINEKDNNYYLNVEEENNTKIINVIYSKKNKTRCLREQEAILLLKTILSSSLTYKEKDGEYDVYLDEADNKRYFKDGKEDFKKFFYNNGVSAIEYDEDEKNKKGKKKEKLAREEKIWRIKFVVGFLVFNIIVDPIILHLIMPQETDYFLYKIKHAITNENLNVEDAKKYIESSKYLSDNDKDLLYNEGIINNVLEISNNERDYTLNTKLKDIKITTYEQEEVPTAAGYYDPLEPNTIHICKNITKDSTLYYDVLSHEYVHLLQNSNEYLYIIESTAELISTEYFNMENNAYIEEIKRVKVLMEIIGPKPVLECVFGVNYKIKFEDEIGKYLEDDDKNKLLELFKNGASNFRENEEELNSDIDELLAKMYKNKYKTDIKDDVIINRIYTSNNKDRIYFNEASKDFDRKIPIDLEMEDFGEITLNEAFTSDQFEKCLWYKNIEVRSEEEYQNILNENIDNPEEIEASYHYELSDGVDYAKNITGYQQFEYEGNIYYEPEAIEKGLITKVYNITIPVEIKSIEEVDAQDKGFIEFKFKDNIDGRAHYYQGQWSNVDCYRENFTYAPTLKEKFKDQYNHEESKNIEILDMLEEEAKNDKSEVKLI